MNFGQHLLRGEILLENKLNSWPVKSCFFSVHQNAYKRLNKCIFCREHFIVINESAICHMVTTEMYA